jgi:hypothetical protein
MREIISGRIWIGNARDSRDVSEILSQEIAAVVDLAIEEAARHFPREMIYCRFPIIDGSGNPPTLLTTAIRALALLFQHETPTLVVCGGGMSRSPAMVAAALSVARGGLPDDWLKQVAAMGPHDVAPGLWNEVRGCVMPHRQPHE